MSLASPCQESMRGDDNSYRSGSWYRGNLPVVPEISKNMGMQYMPGGIGLNIQRGWGNSFRSCSTDLSPKQNGNIVVDHTSTTGERIAGTLKMIDQRSPISPLSPQGIGSDGLPQTSQSQRLYSSERNQMRDDLIHNSSQNHGSFTDQVYIHESFPSNNEHSRESSICIQSSSGGSPLSSQHSQTYSCDSRYFHSAEDAADVVGNAYSGNEQPANLKILEELETALLGPDGDDPVDMEYAYGDHTLHSNSEWSFEALSDFNDFLDQTSNPGYPQTNNADSSMVPDHLQQLPNHGDRNVKEETVNEVNLKIEHCSPSSSREEQAEIEELEIPQGDVKFLLIECAKAIADGRNAANWIAGLRQVVDIFGDPLHRLAAYMVEGLVARLQCSGGHIYKTLKCKEPTSSELLSYMHILYEVCPYFKFGYVAANGAIAEAFKDKDRVHIIDFQIAQGSQWITLIQAFAARQGGSPHVRITGVDDPQSEYARGQGLKLVGERLSKLAESCQVPFEFHALSVFGSDVYADMLEIRPGEALAVNFPLQLHHMPDESVNTSNHRDRLLRMIKGLSPNVVTLVEQEANTNTAPFFPRFMETLSYYTAMFESLDVTLPRDSKERVSVEQHCLARDIVNVIACEGAERVERHELFGKWRSRLTMAGFKSYPLSAHVNSTIKVVLNSYNQNYRLVEKDEALYLGWLDRDLIVASAWK